MGYDGANWESSVAGQYAAIATTYATASYATQGAPPSLTYGNNLVRSYTYNNRLQPNGLWDAVNNSPSNILFLMTLGWATRFQYDAYVNGWMPTRAS
jgi:hypothetical protein